MTQRPASLAAYLTTFAGVPVPLLGVELTGRVYGAHARLVLRQRYRNREAEAIEAIYTFPVPSDASLVGFAMEAGGRRVEATVKEREEAFKVYDDAVNAGHGAALLDQARANVFTASIGNLLPGEETVIEVVYVQALTADEGALRLMVPTLVAPRYIPGQPAGDRTAHGTAEPTDRVPDADRISPAIGAVSYGLSMDVAFDLGRHVDLSSPSHAVVATRDGDGCFHATFQSGEVALDRDLVLVATGVTEPESAVHSRGGLIANRAGGSDGTFALTIVPDLFDPKSPKAARDVVFLVDVSGSMQGASIEQARSALRLCLRHLGEGDRFQVIAFASSFTTFARALVPFNQRTLEEADRWVRALIANGGTEILEPLLAALPSGGGNRDRVIVLLTDGQVGNEAEILDRVLPRAEGARIYTFGIGTNVSDALLRDLSKRTGGATELIHPGERIDDKVTSQFARALASRVEQVTVDFVGLDAGELAPSTLPPLVDGEPWVVYGRYSEAGSGRVEVRGRLRGEQFFLSFPVELPASAKRDGLTALWATARIRDLEAAEPKLSGRRAEASRERIVGLGVEHGVASKYTSFVLVEKRTGARRTSGMPETRPVPVNAPAGWAVGQSATPASPPPAAHVARRASVVTANGPSTWKDSAPLPYRGPSGGGGAGGGATRGGPGGRLGEQRQRPGGPPKAAKKAHPERLGGLDVWYGRASSAGSDKSAPSPSAPSRPEAPPSRDLSSLTALFERQLASGLWEGDDGSPGQSLVATAKALEECASLGVDSSHVVFGALLEKAIEALCAITTGAGDAPAALRALNAALAVAAGPRLQATVKSAILAVTLARQAAPRV